MHLQQLVLFLPGIFCIKRWKSIVSSLFDEELLGLSSLLSGTRIFSPCRTSKRASSLQIDYNNSHVIIDMHISQFSLVTEV